MAVRHVETTERCMITHIVNLTIVVFVGHLQEREYMTILFSIYSATRTSTKREPQP